MNDKYAYLQNQLQCLQTQIDNLIKFTEMSKEIFTTQENKEDFISELDGAGVYIDDAVDVIERDSAYGDLLNSGVS